MKKVMVLMLALIMCVAVFAGCGKQVDEESNDPGYEDISGTSGDTGDGSDAPNDAVPPTLSGETAEFNYDDKIIVQYPSDYMKEDEDDESFTYDILSNDNSYKIGFYSFTSDENRLAKIEEWDTYLKDNPGTYKKNESFKVAGYDAVAYSYEDYDGSWCACVVVDYAGAVENGFGACIDIGAPTEKELFGELIMGILDSFEAR